MKKPRTLESFDKKDLVTLIQQHWFYSRTEMVRKLIWIEYERVSADLIKKSDCLCEALAACALPQDWARYKSLSAEWNRVQRKLDRVFKDVS